MYKQHLINSEERLRRQRSNEEEDLLRMEEESAAAKESAEPGIMMAKESMEMSSMQQQKNAGAASILSAALQLGADDLVMQSYRDFQTGSTSWFFSKNPNLTGKRSNDFTLKTWTGWDTLNSEKRTVLQDLAGLEDNPKRTTANLNLLIDAATKWRKELFAVFWGTEFGGTWTCNIFVGEAIYWAGTSTGKDGHYLSASAIHSNTAPFKKVEPKDLAPGNIVTMHNGGHTEIVTKVGLKYKFADEGFCSIGAGRGDESEIGKEKCDTQWTMSGDREVENSSNAYHKI